MATNQHLPESKHRALPVPAGTTSGDPVRVGEINGIAVTDRATAAHPAGGNAEGEATVWSDGSWHLPVTGAVDEVGQPIYFAEGALSSAEGGARFGVALATQSGDGTIPVEIIPTSPAPAAGV